MVTNVEYGEAESRGLRLTIGRARLKDTGLYRCTASNRYQSITKTVKLIVWPIGNWRRREGGGKEGDGGGQGKEGAGGKEGEGQGGTLFLLTQEVLSCLQT